MDKEDLSIACCWWGDWPDGNRSTGVEYVNRLYRATNKHLTYPHRFFCFTDNLGANFDDGIIVKQIDIPTESREIGKLYFYNPDNGLTGRVIGMDLDTLIIDNIDPFAERDEEFIVRKTFGSRRIRNNTDKKIGGDIVSFDAGWGEIIWTNFDKRTNWLLSKTNGGDERKAYATFLTEDQISFWQDLLPGLYRDKKDLLRNKNIDNARMFSFHGKPYLHSVNNPLVVKHWRNI